MPRLRPLLAAALIASMALGATPAVAKQAQPRGPLSIGSLASLSGDATAYGRDQARGTRLAASRLGGPAGRLALVGADDRSQPDAAVAAMRRLVRRPVAAVIGPTLSPVAEAADPIAVRAGVPVLAATNTTLDISGLASVWRVSLSEEAMIPAAVAAAGERYRLHRAALLIDASDGYARGAGAAFELAARRAGIELTARVSFGTPGEPLDGAVSGLLAGDPQAVLIAARSDAAVAALKAVRAANPTIPIVGGNGFNSDSVIAGAGAAAEGLIVAASWNRGIVSPRSRAFARAYRARFGSAPSAFSAQGYASVEIAAAAARAGAGTTAADVLRGLGRLGTIDTVLGPLRFSASREARYPAAVQIVRAGRFQLLARQPSLRGSWTGLLHQSGMRPFRVRAAIGASGARVRYSGLNCRGRWTPRGRPAGAFRFLETITAGASETCKGTGTVTLRPTGDPNALRYAFHGGGVTSTGVLRRLGPA